MAFCWLSQPWFCKKKIVQSIYFAMVLRLGSLNDALRMFESFKVWRQQQFSKKRDSAKSENSDKWLNLEVNKMTFYVSTLDEKYQNGNLDVQYLHRCHLFSWKSVARCSKSNSKTQFELEFWKSWKQLEPAMFRAIFGYFRARIWTWAWKKKSSQMSVLQLLFCPISVFSSRIWIIKGSKSRSCLKPNWCMFNILDLRTSLPPSQLDRSN